MLAAQPGMCQSSATLQALSHGYLQNKRCNPIWLQLPPSKHFSWKLALLQSCLTSAPAMGLSGRKGEGILHLFLVAGVW